jgi:BlaI family transcriptional regulator, penicillinase repressor
VVRRNRNADRLRFEAAIGREELIGRRLEALADSLCEGSIAPLLMHAARSENLTDRQRRKLLDLIDKIDEFWKKNNGPAETRVARRQPVGARA